MTQRQVRHPDGFLPGCPAPCGHAPRHIEDLRGMRCGGGHFIECCRCDRRTAKYANPNDALRDWYRLVGAVPSRGPAPVFQLVR